MIISQKARETKPAKRERRMEKERMKSLASKKDLPRHRLNKVCVEIFSKQRCYGQSEETLQGR